jgi:hypothetical protein
LSHQITHPDYQNLGRSSVLKYKKNTEVDFLDILIERQIVNYVITGSFKEANTRLSILIGTEFTFTIVDPPGSKPILVKTGLMDVSIVQASFQKV